MWTLKAIHAEEDLTEATKKAKAVADELEGMKLRKVAQKVRESTDETLAYYHFPLEHRRQIHTNNPLERTMYEIRRRSRVVGCLAPTKVQFQPHHNTLYRLHPRLTFMAEPQRFF